MAFDTPIRTTDDGARIGPTRSPRQMLADQEYGGHASVHDDGVASKLGLAGAPIVFSAPWDSLNVLLPIAGYGLLAALVGHFASRVALRQLRTLAQSDVTESQPEVEHDGN